MIQLKRDRTRAFLLGGALVLAGAILLFVAYANVRDEAEVAVQVPYLLTGGIGGLMCTLLGAVVLRSHNDGAVRNRLADVESTNHDLQERVDYLTQLLEAALLPETTVTLPGARSSASVS